MDPANRTACNKDLLDLLVTHHFDIDVVWDYSYPKLTGGPYFEEWEKLEMLLDIILNGDADEEPISVQKRLLDATHMKMDCTAVVLSADKRLQLSWRLLDRVIVEEGHWPMMYLPMRTVDNRYCIQTYIYLGREDNGTRLSEGEVWRKMNLEIVMKTLLLCICKRHRTVHGRITDVVNQVLTPLIDYGKMRRTQVFKKSQVEYKWDKGSVPMGMIHQLFFDPETCRDYDIYTRAIE